MKRLSATLALGLVLCVPLRAQERIPVAPRTEPAAQIQVYFSPRSGCTQAIVAALAQAQREVLVMSYQMTSDVLATALIDASKRGVNVQVILDRGQERAFASDWRRLERAGISVLIDATHPIMHHKAAVIDGEVVVVGSFNWSAQAERNAESLLIIRSPELAKRYADEWRKLKETCRAPR